MSSDPLGLPALRGLIDGWKEGRPDPAQPNIVVVSRDPHFLAALRADGWPEQSVAPSLAVASFRPDHALGVCCHHDKIGPGDLARLPIMNLHGSSLPSYRGPSPITWQIKNNDPAIGLTAHLIDERLDAGTLLHQKTHRIDYGQSLRELERNVSRVLGEMAAHCILNSHSLKPKPLDVPRASYFPFLSVPECRESEPLSDLVTYLQRPRVAVVADDASTMTAVKPGLAFLAQQTCVEAFVIDHEQANSWQAADLVPDMVVYDGMDMFNRFGHPKLTYEGVVALGVGTMTFGALAAARHHSIPFWYVRDAKHRHPGTDGGLRRAAHVLESSSQKVFDELEALWRSVGDS